MTGYATDVGPVQHRHARGIEVGLDQVDPQQGCQRQRDDHRVDHGRPVAVLVAVVHEQDHPGDQERVEGEVERVGDRGERQRGPKQPFVVVGDHVAGDEQAWPGGEQMPGPPRRTRRVRPAPMISATPRRRRRGRRRGRCRASWERRHVGERVAGRQQRHRGEIDEPGLSATIRRPVERPACAGCGCCDGAHARAPLMPAAGRRGVLPLRRRRDLSSSSSLRTPATCRGEPIRLPAV